MTAKPQSQEETTRICIKNVPPNFTDAKLRSHLTTNAQEPLTITDCKILRTKDGVSRKLAFVGFKSADVSCSIVVHCTFALIPTNFRLDRWRSTLFHSLTRVTL